MANTCCALPDLRYYDFYVTDISPSSDALIYIISGCCANRWVLLPSSCIKQPSESANQRSIPNLKRIADAVIRYLPVPSTVLIYSCSGLKQSGPVHKTGGGEGESVWLMPCDELSHSSSRIWLISSLSDSDTFALNGPSLYAFRWGSIPSHVPMLYKGLEYKMWLRFQMPID